MKYAWATNEIFSFLRCLIFRSFSSSIHGMHYSDASKFHIFRSWSSNKGDKNREPSSIRSKNFSALVKVNFHSLSVESEQQTRKINIIHELGISNTGNFALCDRSKFIPSASLNPLVMEILSNSNQYLRSELNVQTCRLVSSEIDFRSWWCWSERVQRPLKRFAIEIRFELFCINSPKCSVDRKAWGRL